MNFELRSIGAKEISYERRLPFGTRTDRVSTAIVELEPKGEIEVVWDDTKKK